ncbi:hypothetical protein TrCOL_g9695 [Triparma columacea]|uniref:PABS domain-containing protein n=1 Tax=Triparma columacea TaxID=722753 RepID=A0A9W7LBF7_9STRA|nr:hypothetical protein TrCOL_g9695 [Triparma columacea]
MSSSDNAGFIPPTKEEDFGLNGMDLIIDGWFHERGVMWPGQSMSLKVEEVLYHGRSLYQDVLFFRSSDHGNVLVLDGVIQVTERDEFAYQEMICHIPMFSHPNPKRVLVIGGGDGGVLREVCRHDVEKVVICEIDKDVIEKSKLYLPSLAKGYDDPRVEVKVMDGNVFMADNPGHFDVIITDSSDPIGPAAALFEAPFYKNMYAALREGGIICTQGECMWLHLDIIKPLISKVAEFATTVEYAYTTIPTYPSGQIGFVIATKGKEEGCKEPSRRDDSIEKVLKYYNGDLHKAAFTLPSFARRAIFE